jgi:hypothetical protein
MTVSALLSLSLHFGRPTRARTIVFAGLLCAGACLLAFALPERQTKAELNKPDVALAGAAREILSLGDLVDPMRRLFLQFVAEIDQAALKACLTRFGTGVMVRPADVGDDPEPGTVTVLGRGDKTCWYN